MKKSILCVIGARPQFIKHAVLAPVIRDHFSVFTANTFQHYDNTLNRNILADLHMPPADFNLDAIDAERPAKRTIRMFRALTGIMKRAAPSGVLVYGDTDSTLAGALAAKHLAIPLVHIESGERSFNSDMPEETNRVITDQLSNLLFCVSNNAVENLRNEGVPGKVLLTGDLLKDLLLKTEAASESPPVEVPYYFASLHRKYTQENLKRLEAILCALDKLEHPVVFSLHPSTEKTIIQAGIPLKKFRNISFTPGLSYTQSIAYQKFSKAIITDSGGMQKEAYWLRKPCITLRPETEWTETLQGNWNQLLYNDLDIRKALAITPGAYNSDLYGNGNAAMTIVEELKEYFYP